MALDVHERYPKDPMLGLAFGGKYCVVDVIGAGGFGAVYRAIQQPVGHEVAVKVILGQHVGNAELSGRFRQEAQVIARLRHSSTVTLIDYGEDHGALFMVLELVHGRELRDALKGGQRFEPERAVRIATEILQSLYEAHQMGMAHRDLKPENVMLVPTPFGGETVKILDFGIAKVLQGDAEEYADVRTQEDTAIGSPLYMAPEQARGLAVAQSDLYSLGVMLFEMLSGTPPFRGRTPMDILLQHAMAERPDVPGASPALNAVVKRAMAKDPVDRYAGAAEMAEALNAAVGAVLTQSQTELMPLAEPQDTAEQPTADRISTQMIGALEETPVPLPSGGTSKRWLVVAALVLVGGAVALFALPSNDALPNDAGPAPVVHQISAVRPIPAPDSAVDALAGDAAADATVDGPPDAAVDPALPDQGPDATPVAAERPVKKRPAKKKKRPAKKKKPKKQPSELEFL